MPVENKPKGPPNKPITPALSSRFRTAKTPLAPRVAGSSPASPAASITRSLREQTISPPTIQKQPLSLHGNVTPRSGPRNTRISTESPGSPQANRRLSGNSSIQGTLLAAKHGSSINNPASNALTQNRLTTKASSPNISTARRISGASNVSRKDEDAAKFFRANDAKTPSNLQSAAKSTISPRPLSTSFLKSSSPRAVNSAPPSALHNGKEDGGESFVRANDFHLRAARALAGGQKQSATSKTSMNSASARPAEVTRTQSHPHLRTQPIKQSSSGKAAITITTPPTSPSKPLSSQPSPVVRLPNSPSDRRRSFGTSASHSLSPPSRPPFHKKSASVSSFGPLSILMGGLPHLNQPPQATWMSATVTIPNRPDSLTISSPETLSPRSASLASSKTMGTSVTSDTDASEISKPGISLLTSGQLDASISSTQSTQPQPTPLAQAQLNAANARRERKVLDLEISNSSLLAINKTLEKELKKQSAELRRFRRLSRSGRLSFAPSNRSVSGQSALSLDTLQEQTEDEHEYSDDDEKEEESDLDELDEDVDVATHESLDGTTARARQRARDEQRLMHDLSKHQQLLIDSQKLTLTIRKCLSLSEDLIKQGNQALKYKVGIGDVKLGGRVLSAEDLDVSRGPGEVHHPEQDTELPRQGLLSPSLSKMEIQEASLWLGSNPQDEILDPFSSEDQEPD